MSKQRTWDAWARLCHREAVGIDAAPKGGTAQCAACKVCRDGRDPAHRLTIVLRKIKTLKPSWKSISINFHRICEFYILLL